MSWYRSPELKNDACLDIALFLVLIRTLSFKPQFHSLRLFSIQLNFIMVRIALVRSLLDINNIRRTQIELERALLTHKPRPIQMFSKSQPLFSFEHKKSDITLNTFTKTNINQLSKPAMRIYKHNIGLSNSIASNKTKEVFDLFVLYIINCQSSALGKFDLIHPRNRWYVKHVLKVGPKTTTLTFNFETMFCIWVDTYSLLINVAFYKIKIFTFGRLEFKQMIEAFNWAMWPFSTLEWRDNTQYFYNAPSIYSTTYRNFFERFALKANAIHFFFDCHYHHKTLKYLSDLPVVVIGTMDLALDPWYLTHPLPVVTNSFFSHYFIYTYLLKAFRQAESCIYKNTYLQYNQLLVFMLLQRASILLFTTYN